MGDAAGIGPEIIIKALSQNKNLISPVIFGSEKVFKKTLKKLDIKIKCIEIIDCKVSLDNIESGKVSSIAGRASVICIKEAVKFALTKKIDAIVTAPICKESINKAGFNYPGHTELIAELTNTKNFAMMFVGKNMKVVLVTIHLSLKDVSKNLTKEKVKNAIMFLMTTLKRYFNINIPYIAVAGLNPHAGESGIFGNEEEEIIMPVISEIRKNFNIKLEGPIPADTLFYKNTLKKFDAIVCMYHDQGLIPFKMLNFENGVNVTIGLPIIRTSPDHGVAYDISGRGIANPESMIAAIKLASFMAKKQ